MSFRRGSVSRGTQQPAEFEAFEFRGLLNINAMPQSVNDSQLTIAVNVYGDVDGGLEMRRGTKRRGVSFSDTARGQNGYRFFQQVVAGLPLSVPRYFLLGQSQGGTMWDIDTDLQVGATGALGTSAKSWSVARIYDPQTAGGTDVMVICTGDGGPYLFDGTSIITIPAWTAQAGNARWCQVSNGTLWFGGISAQPTLLVQTKLGLPRVIQQSFVCSYPITGLSTLGAGSQSGLVFGMTQGVGVSFGVNSASAYVQEIPHEDGVTAGRTMIAVNGLVYFLGAFNIYSFDGQNIVPIGDNVRPWIIDDPVQQDFPMNGDRSLSFSWYYNERIYFAYDSNNLGYCQTYLVWHMKQQGWTVLTGPKLSGATLLNAPGDPFPTACVVVDSLRSVAYNWDVFNGLGKDGHNVDDDGTPIKTSILTKYFRLSGSGTQSRLVGIAPELFVEQFDGNIVVGTDYGLSSFEQMLSRVDNTNTLIWDQTNWDAANWGGASILAYVVKNFQVEDDQQNVAKAYTFAFGVTTNDTNPPYRFAGLSGEFATEGRHFDSAA